MTQRGPMLELKSPLCLQLLVLLANSLYLDTLAYVLLLACHLPFLLHCFWVLVKLTSAVRPSLAILAPTPTPLLGPHHSST